jgi:hypothetical protein
MRQMNSPEILLFSSFAEKLLQERLVFPDDKKDHFKETLHMRN